MILPSRRMGSRSQPPAQVTGNLHSAELSSLRHISKQHDRPRMYAHRPEMAYEAVKLY
jgi:hypothetical protein